MTKAAESSSLQRTRAQLRSAATDYYQQALAIERARGDEKRTRLILARLNSLARAQQQ